MSTEKKESLTDKILNDLTNKLVIKDEESAKRARAHGWKEPVQFAYDVYNATSREGRDAAAKQMVTMSVDPSSDPQVIELAGNEHQKAVGESFTVDVPFWASDAARYEWKDEYGDVGPAHPDLERQLFHDVATNRQGKNIELLHSIAVNIDSETQVKPVFTFEDAGLHPVILENVKKCGYEKPTPVQAYCLPAIHENRDVIAVAQTGSGKTAAFLVPILSKLMGKAKKLAAPRPDVSDGFDPFVNGVMAEPLVLILAPTRELSIQIFNEARKLCYRSMLRPCVAYGGGPSRAQADELRKGCDILIGSPGRVVDFMSRNGLLSLSRVRYTVLDEADEMVGGDWDDELNSILRGGDKSEDADHRYMLFSATFPKEARALAKNYLDDGHVRIRMGRGGSTLSNIVQNIVEVEERLKRECLFDLLMSTPPARTMIFVNSKKSADLLDDFLFNRGLPSTSIHSDRTQQEREDAFRAFRSGKAPLLVATGLSARGLDVRNVMHIINYDLPSTEHGGIQEYVHRIGRTARIGNDGIATSFFSDRNDDIGPALTKLLLETDQKIPDFLEQYKPQTGEVLDFEDDSDDENQDGGDSGAFSAEASDAGSDGQQNTHGDESAPQEYVHAQYQVRSGTSPQKIDDDSW